MAAEGRARVGYLRLGVGAQEADARRRVQPAARRLLPHRSTRKIRRMGFRPGYFEKSAGLAGRRRLAGSLALFSAIRKRALPTAPKRSDRPRGVVVERIPSKRLRSPAALMLPGIRSKRLCCRQDPDRATPLSAHVWTALARLRISSQIPARACRISFRPRMQPAPRKQKTFHLPWLTPTLRNSRQHVSDSNRAAEFAEQQFQTDIAVARFTLV